MAVEAVQDVMAILPDRLDHHQRRAGRDAAEHFHAALLAIDEAVTFGGVAGVAAFDRAAQPPDGAHDGFLGARLGRPAFLVGGQAQIAVRNQDDRIWHDHIFASRAAGVHGAAC
jgi:hypothetical protein